MEKDYTVKNDPMFQNYIENTTQPLSQESIDKYESIMNKFCKITNNTLENIITKCKEEQHSKVKPTTNNESIIIEFDPNEPNTTIRKIFTKFTQECKKRGNKNVTINYQTTVIKTFLKYYKIKIPTLKKLEDDSEQWNLLTKEDLKFVLDDSNILHKSLITFLLSSGLRIGDALNLTIGDFMEATKEYHNFIEVDDFIDNAPEDMIGYWEFDPKKTKRYSIQCQTFNSAESSNYILQSLRRIKTQYIPYKQKESKTTIKMSKNDALFGSRSGHYKEHIIPNSISRQFTKKGDKLKEWNQLKIQKQIEEGKISQEDYEKELKKIPKFHAHACRKYFDTIISKNCGDIRICTILEGHRSPIRTDKSYIKKDKDELKEAYLKALEDLTIEKINPKLLTNKQVTELEGKINKLEQETEEKDQYIKQLEQEIATIKEDVNTIKQENTAPNILQTKIDIGEYIEKLATEEKITKEEVIPLIQLMREKLNSTTFNGTEQELKDLYKKSYVELKFGKQTREELVKRFTLSIKKTMKQSKTFDKTVQSAIEKIYEDETLVSMIKDEEALQTDIINQINFRIINKTLNPEDEEEINQLIHETLMKHI